MATNLADDIFNRIFLNENVKISIKISLKCVSKGPEDDKSALVQVMAWRQTVHWRIYAALGGDELNTHQISFTF